MTSHPAKKKNSGISVANDDVIFELCQSTTGGDFHCNFGTHSEKIAQSDLLFEAGLQQHCFV